MSEWLPIKFLPHLPVHGATMMLRCEVGEFPAVFLRNPDYVKGQLITAGLTIFMDGYVCGEIDPSVLGLTHFKSLPTGLDSAA